MDEKKMQVLVAMLATFVGAFGGELDDWLTFFGFTERFDPETLGLLRVAFNDITLRVHAEQQVFRTNVTPLRAPDLPGGFIAPGSLPPFDDPGNEPQNESEPPVPVTSSPVSE